MNLWVTVLVDLLITTFGAVGMIATVYIYIYGYVLVILVIWMACLKMYSLIGPGENCSKCVLD